MSNTWQFSFPVCNYIQSSLSAPPLCMERLFICAVLFILNQTGDAGLPQHFDNWYSSELAETGAAAAPGGARAHE